MNKRGIVLLLLILVIAMPFVDASLGDLFSNAFTGIGNFFKGIFGKGAVGIPSAQYAYTLDVNQSSGYVPLTVMFVVNAGPVAPNLPEQTTNAIATTNNNPIIAPAPNLVYEWHFGDTIIESTTINTKQHTYYSSGGYSAYVVIKQNNVILATTNNILITVNQIPHLITAAPQNGTAPLNVKFVASPIYSIEPPVNPGQVTPNLPQQTGNAIATTNNPPIIAPAPNITPTIAPAPPVPTIVYEWHFGDNNIETTSSNTINHIYNSPGFYMAYAIIKDNNVVIVDQTNVIKIIVVEETNLGNITLIPSSLDFGHVAIGSSSSQNVEIINNGQDSLDISLTVEDPEFTVNQENFILEAYSSYTITVNFTPISAGVIEGFIQAFISDEKLFDYPYTGEGIIPIPYTLTALPSSSGYVPLTVTFTATQTEYIGSPYSNITNFTPSLDNNLNPIAPIYYEWNFGDSTETTIANTVQHTYENTGSYTAHVNIIQNNNLIGSSDNLIIDVQTAPSSPGGGGEGGGGSGGGGGGGGGGSGGSGGSCIPQWSCNLWNSCSSSTETQTRMCSDFNNCNTNEGKPSEIQSCTPTLASNLGITKIAEDIGGEIQDFVNKSGSIKSTHIALILLFVLIILCSLFIYLRGPFRKKRLDNNLKVQKIQAPQAITQTTFQTTAQAPIYHKEIKPELRIIIGAVIKAKSDGFSKGQIENELRSKGWKEEQIKEILSYI